MKDINSLNRDREFGDIHVQFQKVQEMAFVDNQYQWIGTVANYCNRQIVKLPPELYDLFPKGTPIIITIKKL